MSRSSSRSPSPSRKRQRLSSPTYDEHLQDLAPEALDAFDAIDASQSPKKPYKGHSEDAAAVASMSSWGSARALHSKSHSSSLHDDPENPFNATVASSSTNQPLALFATASSLPMMGFAPASASTSSGFASASTISGFTSASGASHTSHDYERSPSPEAPPEQDYDSWFQPAPADVPIAFQTAKFTAAAAAFGTVTTAAPAIDFMKASNKGILAPSTAALAKARDIMKDIWTEEELTENMAPPALIDTGFKSASSKALVPSSQRPALRAVENAFNSPVTPSPVGFLRPSLTGGPSTLSPSNRTRPKPFKSPLMKNKPPASSLSNSYAGSPLNPNRPSGFTSAASQQHPLSMSVTAPVSTPRKQISSASNTPGGSTARSRPVPFVTPFKQGMKPGEAGRKELDERVLSARKPTPAKEEENWLTRERPPYTIPEVATRKYFDLTIPPDRITLKKCGLIPQRFEPEELEMFGVSYEELNQITPQLAIYYSFHTPFSVPLLSQDPPPTLLGPQAALKLLHERGCALATQPWVDNHWGLILWKLAALAALAPQHESDPAQRKWCWNEVIRQLLYRYERELNSGSRPPLRLVVTGDAPAALSMVLCVSDIKWLQTPAGDGTPGVPYPELEVTDGWYRLRAQVDAPMARAVSRGIIAIGRKMVVASARLSSEKKDPVEILEAYKSTKLVLSGNSSHMVPWHAKLGFTGAPCVSTLHSLSPDGGNVAAVDLVIVKTYPIAYIEFLQDEHGNKSQEGPRNEAEEMGVNDEWKKKRELAASKLREVFEKKQARYEGYMERLERKAGDCFHPGEDDYPPDNIDSVYDELEVPAEATSVISRLSPNEAGWLIRHIRNCLDMERERFGEQIEKELEELCPSRNVRNFRILIVEDARTIRRPPRRKAQLTVWDVLNLSLSEGQPPGTFEAGHRYMVTNLNPTHHKAWMHRFDLDSEIFMCTGRSSRWRKVKPERY